MFTTQSTHESCSCYYCLEQVSENEQEYIFAFNFNFFRFLEIAKEVKILKRWFQKVKSNLNDHLFSPALFNSLPSGEAAPTEQNQNTLIHTPALPLKNLMIVTRSFYPWASVFLPIQWRLKNISLSQRAIVRLQVPNDTLSFCK